MRVTLSGLTFTYDVHSLVKAFYPREDVTVVPPSEDAGSIQVDVFPENVPDGVRADGYIKVAADAGRTIELEERFEGLTRFEIKSTLKRVLYTVLEELTGTSLPWGTMTGIRPTKVPMKLIREGCGDAGISSYMKSVYLASDEKIRLATDIAHTEADIIDSLPGNSFGLYIGIPFCPTTCLYCSFTSYPEALWKERIDDYLAALGSELDLLAEIFKNKTPSCIYIGGGTPTTLSAERLGALMEGLGRRFDLSQLREFTVEAGRADSITEEKLAAIYEAGASRISINPQTMNDKTLRVIGRRHSTDDVYRAFEMARAAGFTNINTDIILGLPGEDESDVANTLEGIKKLAPDSLTVHCMAVKRAAHMKDYLADHKETEPVVTAEMVKMCAECAAYLGMKPYYLYRQKNMAGGFENVGYARDDCFGIYNIVMMEEISDIAAAGAGTISKHVYPDGRIERCDNVKDAALYIDRIDEMKERKIRLFEYKEEKGE